MILEDQCLDFYHILIDNIPDACDLLLLQQSKPLHTWVLVYRPPDCRLPIIFRVEYNVALNLNCSNLREVKTGVVQDLGLALPNLFCSSMICL